MHDALKRRCLYHWVEHPDFEREVKIVRMRVPNVIEPLARQVAAAVEAMRGLNLYKPPGVAETIDWAQALGALGVTELDEATVESTLGTVLKYREDQERARQHGIADMVKQAFERGMQQPRAPTRLDARRRRSGWPSTFARVLRGASLRVPIGNVLMFVEALGRVGIDRSRQRVLGGAIDARAPARGPPAVRPGVRRVLGARPASNARRRRARDHARSRWPPTTTSETDDDDDEPARRTTTRR